MEDKITGVCVDIPTIIKRAKVEHTFTEEFYKQLERASDKLAKDLDLIGRSDATSHLPQWISVKERLPEDDRPVLGWDGIHFYESRLIEQEIIPFDPDRAYEKRILIQNSDGGFLVDPILPITHWMPLPEPPK
jgi:hypothetical protein